MSKYTYILLFAALIFLHSTIASAETTLPNTVTELRIELDRINFDLKEGDQLNRLKHLIDHTIKLADQNPKDAGYLLMAGFYNIQYASNLGGVGAIKYAKTARGYLDRSIAVDPTLFGASAHAVLGRMYVSIPGWPLAFGDKKKGLMNFRQALEIAPDSIDANFTYSTYLFEKKKYSEAKKHLEKAKIAPPRPNRTRADEELHKIIDQMLIEIDKKTA